MPDVEIQESLALSNIRAAWDAYRHGEDLTLSDAWLFAAGYLAAQSARPAGSSQESYERIGQLASLLVRGHSVTISNMFCDGEPVGRMLVEAVAAKSTEGPGVDDAARERLLNLARDVDFGASLSYLQDEAARILDTIAGGQPSAPPAETEELRRRSAERLASYQAAAVGASVNAEKGFLHDYVESEFVQRTKEETLELERYQWVRQPSNLNCMMFEFKGNTPAAVDAYIDRQTRALAVVKA